MQKAFDDALVRIKKRLASMGNEEFLACAGLTILDVTGRDGVALSAFRQRQQLKNGGWKMTIDEAIRILDPETTLTALCEIEYYAGFRGEEAKVEACDEACRLAVAVMRAQLTPIAYARWIEEPGKVPRCPVCGKYSDDAGNGAMICPWCGHRLKQDKENERV